MFDHTKVLYQRLIFPLLALVDAEQAHHAALGMLRLLSQLALPSPAGTPVDLLGLRFPNAVGLAAGFDKNAVAVRGLAALGFGHIEIGTVTPRAQPGGPRPRVFRLKEDRALINRLGFPSDGMEVVGRRLQRLRNRTFVLGVNVGPNAGSVGPEDFARAARRLAPLADYLAINVSSPNTSGLRGLQQRSELESVLAAVQPEIQQPLLVKIAPDLRDEDISEVVDVLIAHSVAGVIATNTTIERPAGLRSPNGHERGGLSGRPLEARSTEVVRLIARRAAGRLAIIGVGGISDVASARAKLDAGASLVQLYTAFIYGGPLLPRRITSGLRGA